MDAFGIRAILPRPKGQGLPRIQIKADLDAGRLKLVLPNYLSEGGTVSVLLPSRRRAHRGVNLRRKLG